MGMRTGAQHSSMCGALELLLAGVLIDLFTKQNLTLRYPLRWNENTQATP